MFELLLCATFTILPDYLFRCYAQGKRFGHEITFYSVWFELRWGIVTCLLLTVGLITAVFYFHPSTTNVNTAQPGTILAALEPLYAGGLDGVTPGSSCIANGYTSNQIGLPIRTPAP